MNMRYLAISAAKLSSSLIRLSGMGMGSSFPGKIATKLNPSILSSLTKQIAQGCIAISGTNGKSTTAGLLASILRTAGYKIVHNRQGANLVAGITASLVEAANIDGSLKTDLGLFEVDEAALPKFAQQVNCKIVVVTNLFRDQLDRYGELDTAARLITKGIQINKSIAILNADDPNVCSLPCPAAKVYYGLDYKKIVGHEDQNECANKEISYCPLCGQEIEYENNAEQTNLWHCSKCDYGRPTLDIYASQIDLLSRSSKFRITNKEQSLTVNLPLPGLFNIYNAIAASAAASSIGISLEKIKEGLQAYETLFGRSEKLKINGRTIIIQLIKNPAGATQSLKSLVDLNAAQVMIAINDNLADGRDVSWLWDAQFEILASLNPQCTVSGHRAEDMAIRLKYAGVEETNITSQPDLALGFEQAINRTPIDSTLWVLPTYTALLELQKILKRYKIDRSKTLE